MRKDDMPVELKIIFSLYLCCRMVELLQSKGESSSSTEVTNSLTQLLNGDNKSKKSQVSPFLTQRLSPPPTHHASPDQWDIHRLLEISPCTMLRLHVCMPVP